MNIQLPVNMVPLPQSAAKSGGFVLAVLVGLALFMVAKRQNQSKTKL